MSEDVKLWSCPECAFSFDSLHEDEGGGYTCPLCENTRLLEALKKIIDWADAYPLDVFPEPDLEYVAQVLKQAAESTGTHGPISLDCVSASNMRHCLKGAKRIARAALPPR